MDSTSKSVVLVEELPETEEPRVVCRCSNVCNRASGRGCCPCLARSRKCGGLCRCGTAKMRCKNRAVGEEETHIDENVVEDDSAENASMTGKLTDLDEVSEDNFTEEPKRGRKRKGRGRPPAKLKGPRSHPNYKTKWELKPELRQWLTTSNKSRHAFCIFCECEFNLDKDSSSCLIKHSRCKKHTKFTKLWTEANPDQDVIETKKRVLEDIPEFKPWLRLQSMTGSAYCLRCKAIIKDGETLDVLRRHKTSKRHRNMAAQKGGVISESEEEVVMPIEPKRKWRRMNQEEVIHPSDSEQSEGDEEEEGEREEEDGYAYDDDLQIERGSNLLGSETIWQQATESEAKLLSFMVENNVPLKLTDSLVSLLKGLPSVGLGFKRILMDYEKAADMVKQSNDSFLNEILVERLKKRFFYIAIDIRMESPHKNHVGIFVIFCSPDLSIEVELLDVKDCGEGTAEDIYNCLTDTLKQKEKEGIPLHNWMGLLCDTTNVSFHTMFSVMAMIAGKYEWVSPLVCPSRMAELSAITACKSLPENLEHFCNLVHEHFQSGPKQAVSFLDYKELCNERKHVILNAKDISWLAMNDFLGKLLEQWHPLQTYFTCLMKTEPDEKYNLVLEMFSNPLMKILLMALKFAVDVINTYSDKVAVGEPLFATLDEETNELIRTFANFFMKNDVVAVTEDLTKLCVTDEETYLPLSQLYLGFDSSGALTSHMEQNQLSFEDANVVQVLQVVRGFYREFITHLQVSLQMSLPMRSLVSLLDPQNAVNVEAPINGNIFSSFSNSDVIDVKQVQEEWHSVSNVGLPSNEILESPLVYWRYVLAQNAEGLKNLQNLVSYFFSLPVLHSSEEKIFTFMKHWNLKAWKRLTSANLWTYRNAQSKLQNSHCINGQADGEILREVTIIELPLQ
ncbi:hypothetical protein HOLleu_24722 [Holothuria leucospilota]|uniref:Uncharacterized protein n=1 Tax=Holothuria leucospilota TaxID=206669 RepID=A0A9Q1H1E5_HOLLE|nr:hypothetical protein HOLleu_24722 [Holothuria leucospilota]